MNSVKTKGVDNSSLGGFEEDRRQNPRERLEKLQVNGDYAFYFFRLHLSMVRYFLLDSEDDNCNVDRDLIEEWKRNWDHNRQSSESFRIDRNFGKLVVRNLQE